MRPRVGAPDRQREVWGKVNQPKGCVSGGLGKGRDGVFSVVGKRRGEVLTRRKRRKGRRGEGGEKK